MRTHAYLGDPVAKTLHADLDGVPLRCVEMPFSHEILILGGDVLAARHVPKVHGKTIVDGLSALGVSEGNMVTLRWTRDRHERSTVMVTLGGLSQAFGDESVTLMDSWRAETITVGGARAPAVKAAA